MKKTAQDKLFIELFGKNLWKKLDKESREYLLNKSDEQRNDDTKTIKKTIRLYKSFSLTEGTLIIGTMFGIFGSFIVNAFERIYAKYYADNDFLNFLVIMVGFGIVYLLIKQLERESEKILTLNKNIRDLVEKNNS